MMFLERIGPLRYGLTMPQVRQMVGPPERTGGPWPGAAGQYLQWVYTSSGLELTFTKEDDEPWALGGIAIEAPSTLSTRFGIRIGSSKQQVERAYGLDQGEEGGYNGTDEFVVGSPYGGVVFTFDKDRVTRVFVGHGAD